MKYFGTLEGYMCSDDTWLIVNNGLLNEQQQFQMQSVSCHVNQPDAALKSLYPSEGVLFSPVSV